MKRIKEFLLTYKTAIQTATITITISWFTLLFIWISKGWELSEWLLFTTMPLSLLSASILLFYVIEEESNEQTP